VNGFPQGPNGLIVPNGSLKMQLNVDGTIIANPGGFVAADIPVVFQFDKNGALIQPAKIWSNEELDPQNTVGLGTFYLVTFYDQNGAILNNTPLWWIFPEIINSTVDISQMVAISTVGGNVIYYPRSVGNSGTVTSVAFVGDGVVDSATPSTPVTTSGNITATILTQSANTVLAGPTTGVAAAPTFRTLVAADISGILTPAGSDTDVQVNSGGSFYGDGNFTYNHTTQIVASTIFNAVTGFRIAGAAASGKFLRGNGTNFVSSGIQSGDVTWDQIGNAAGALTLANGTNATTFNQTSAVNWIWANTTAATNTVPQNSPILNFEGTYWTGSASAADIWTIQDVVASGTNPVTTLTFLHSGSSGTAQVTMPQSLTLGTAGVVTGIIHFNGVTGSASIGVNGTAGSTRTIALPSAEPPADGSLLQGSASGNPNATSWTMTPSVTSLSAGTLFETTTHTPSSHTDTGTTGQIAWDSGFIYVCIATNSWARVAIASW
jgi:hypothetical protein